MEKDIYVDILLVINYLVNLLLLTGTAKIAGRRPRGRRIVAAALWGAVCSLTIFLPPTPLWLSLGEKLLVSASVVLIAFRWLSGRVFAKELLLFFAVTFCFAGVLLGLWFTLRPQWMTYYGGVVYLDISSFTLLVSTVAAYALLEILWRLLRRGPSPQDILPVSMTLGPRSVALTGLVDTGNALREPFSGTPVIVCSLEDIAPLLPHNTVAALSRGDFAKGLWDGGGLPLRGVPYGAVGAKGLLPAFRGDKLTIGTGPDRQVAESFYVAISLSPIGDERYNTLLHPEILAVSLPVSSQPYHI